jgi:endonuclease/exonuclease/phosphatase (EEP) superfamily protein YafD
LDIDVAGPYSTVDQAELAEASPRAGLPLNPDPLSQENHLEWVGPLRLCLPPPQAGIPGLKLWQGRRLTLVTGSVPDLVASKLIRYDETDQGDIQFLYTQFRFEWLAVQQSVARLPQPFSTHTLVLENLENLKADMAAWGGNRP